MWRVATRPRWIGALVLALAVAAAFAALGQWQLERSIATGDIVTRATETVVELGSVASPQAQVTAAADGQRVRVGGSFVPGDYVVLGQRLHEGEPGFWVVGHLSVPEAASDSAGEDDSVGEDDSASEDGAAGEAGLAVALGWTPSEAEAEAVAQRLAAEAPEPRELVGRYLVGEGPQDTDVAAGALHSLAPAALINLWSVHDAAGTFGGYLVADSPAAGLVAIDAPPPPADVEVNWLNIFYAVEWVIFAGFAVFLWWRLVRDAWEVEQAAAEAEGDGEAPDEPAAGAQEQAGSAQPAPVN